MTIFLWLSIGLALMTGLVSPYGSRLHATGLWAGKAIVPQELADAYPRGMQDPLTDGWPSWLGLASSLLPVLAGVVGFFHAWWFGPIAYLLAIAIGVAGSKTNIASPYVDFYLAVLLTHAQRREAKFRDHGDKKRVEAIEPLIRGLEDLLIIYAGKRVATPDIKDARSAPHGDQKYLLRKAS